MGSTIPLIDFSKFTNGTVAEQAECARQILDAFMTSGFIYLSNHGIDKSHIDLLFTQSAQFFSLPSQAKLKVAYQSTALNRGYAAVGQEKLDLATDAADVNAHRLVAPDYKETFQIGNDRSAANPFPTEAMPSMEPLMNSFFQQCSLVQLRIMQAIAQGLSLPTSYFDTFFEANDHNLRLLHYPPIAKETLDAQGGIRANRHSDYGSITMLFQDDVGGLQVEETTEDVFVNARPVEGTIVVNAGDLLSRWSNDRIRSTRHRVVQPPTSSSLDTYPDRYSIAFFCQPDYDKVIECIETCRQQSLQKYEPVQSGDYLQSRLNATYG